MFSKEVPELHFSPFRANSLNINPKEEIDLRVACTELMGEEVGDLYCWGCKRPSVILPLPTPLKSVIQVLPQEIQLPKPTILNKKIKSGSRKCPVKERKRKTNLPDLDPTFLKILKRVKSGDNVSIKAREKTTRGLHNGLSKRRSQYIGVLKNNGRYQVLINVGKLKRYVGTYFTEDQAALVHDLYSIGLNYINAKTNFSYSSEELVPIIEHYFESNSQFDPSKFI